MARSLLFALLFTTTASIAQVAFPDTLYNSLEWRCIGPWRGGRSCAVTGVPGQPNLFYFGSAGGGVWRSKDGGNSWENITDGYFGGSIGAVAVSEWDNNVIYVGGGEKTVRGNVSFGYGIWKSVDAGKSWTQMGLEKSRHIGRIRIHPKDPDRVYAAVMGDLYKPSEERGVYRSTDGGRTWDRVLFANADAGAVDLTFDPTNPRILYASTWRIRRTPYSLESGGEGSALWKSTDGGDTWTNLMERDGMPEGPIGIIGLTVSPAKPERVWAIIEAKEGGVFRSDDGGDTWTRINDSRALRQRAWYYSRIIADPQDEEVVYVMNVRYHKSTDGGKTFTPHVAPHGDHHDLWIAPEDPDRMIIGDDGGAQVSFDGGENWSTYQNQPTAQFYRVTTDDHFPFRIYAAQQDNSTIRILHRTESNRIGERHWEPTAGGESAHIAVDPADNEIVYGGSYGGYLTRKNHATGQEQAINVWPDNPMGYGAEGMKYRFQWNFPVFFSPHDPKKLYAASNHLHLSTDRGQSWTVISPDLTRNDSSKLGPSGGPITKDNTGVEYYCTIFAACESPYEEGLLWTGSDDGLLHLSRDGGENWTEVTPKNMPDWMMINSLEPDPFHPGGLYVAGTRYKLGDYAPYLYHTTDYGKSWRRITDGIPEEHFTRVLRADPAREGLLYCGTESGLYISFDNGQNWQPFQRNLPIVPITDLALKNGSLIAATQGRSLWVLDDLSPLHQLDGSIAGKDMHLYQPAPSIRMDGRQNKKVKGAGINHPNGVQVHYFLKELGPDTPRVELVFLEQDGREIRRFSTKAEEKESRLEVQRNGNAFVWDMRYPGAKEFDGMVMWWAGLDGPRAVPGDYRVRLLVGPDSLQQPFTILPDPRSTAGQDALQAQFDFMQEVNATVTEAHEAIIRIRETRKQLKPMMKRWAADEAAYGELLAQAEVIDSLFTEVEESLYQTKNRSRQDPLNYPIRLTNKLAHLNELVEVGDFRPTEQSYAVKRELEAAINRQLARYRRVLREEVPVLNRLVQELDVPLIEVERSGP